MKQGLMLAMLSIGLLLVSSTMTVAADMTEDQWKQTINHIAETDPVGFRAKLASRFSVDGAQLDVVFATVDSPADAYFVLVSAQKSGKPLNYVLERYKSENGKWGAIAENLGIKGKD